MNVQAPRATIERAIRRELFGPDENAEPCGRPIDCTSRRVQFDNSADSHGQFHDSATHQEILTQSDPLHRYGIGVLHPGGTSQARNDADSAPDEELIGIVGLPTSDEDLDIEPTRFEIRAGADIPDSDDFDLTDANRFKPSAMAISFRAQLGGSDTFRFEVSGAYYDKVKVLLADRDYETTWWVRVPFTLRANLPGSKLAGNGPTLVDVPLSSDGGDELRLRPQVTVWSRPVPGATDPGLRLVTAAVINTARKQGAENALFQMGLHVRPEGANRIEPYPRQILSERDEEEQSLDLLYRNKLTFAIGHGCAAAWRESSAQPGTAQWVGTDPFPSYEVPSLTPMVFEMDSDGRRHPVEVSMHALANGEPEGAQQVDKLLQLYGEWIDARESEIADLPPSMRPAATRHIQGCRRALDRMHEGWSIITTDPFAQRAFAWANEAMMFQQLRSKLDKRPATLQADAKVSINSPHPDVAVAPGRGMWRPFQIAFILATIPELVDSSHPNRNTVDLIFFPTGGGKTEAYLGVAAVSLLLRRLRDPEDAGTDTLMRYTLRLLTTQQFVRAAALICVLEDIRSRNASSLGTRRFGIGIWLGGSTTPNTWRQARENLKLLRRKRKTQNYFLLLRCPWCGAQMGPVAQGKEHIIVGYEEAGNKVVLCCVDPQCRYSRATDPLPIHVVDEDIYDARPSVIVGTIDKFAMLAWRPEARKIFGLGDDGARDVSPPNLILQDELHLISGPLGSMAGLYEPIIDDLCTDRRSGVVVPKIIASTATIRRYGEQIRGVFGRTDVELFPPHGLTEGDSFFAEPALSDGGEPQPGRRYLGVMSASLGSTQTVQVRVLSAVLQAATEIPEASRDGYWTNLNFFNSLRELGNTVSLIQSDVPDYLTGLRRRDGIDPRWPRRVMELTSRRRNDEIPKAIEDLEVAYGHQDCLDLCLASNIIEVGVDIDRLALMTIVGQPKTTAQYVQVSGRIGRRPDQSPGLVITIYGAAKPRDRSHYEHFRTYHEQLYAQVEPTSVTPFATPVLRRALHAAIVAGIRQNSPGVTPHPLPLPQFDAAATLLEERVQIVDPAEAETLRSLTRRRQKEWGSWERTEWNANDRGGDPVQGLMRYAGALPNLDAQATIWDVPTSMRNVDAECRLSITKAYSIADAKEGDGE